MRQFKFLKKPFNGEDYDLPNFRFLGVSPLDNRNKRTMIFVHTPDGTIVPAQLIGREHEAYHYADIYEVRGNQIFLIPRKEIEYINVNLTYTTDDTI